jgi:hypothetical protein
MADLPCLRSNPISHRALSNHACAGRDCQRQDGHGAWQSASGGPTSIGIESRVKPSSPAPWRLRARTPTKRRQRCALGLPDTRLRTRVQSPSPRLHTIQPVCTGEVNHSAYHRGRPRQILYLRFARIGRAIRYPGQAAVPTPQRAGISLPPGWLVPNASRSVWPFKSSWPSKTVLPSFFLNPLESHEFTAQPVHPARKTAITLIPKSG